MVHSSDDPNVPALILQQALRFDSQTPREAMGPAMQPTPLPKSYPDENGGNEAAEMIVRDL